MAVAEVGPHLGQAIGYKLGRGLSWEKVVVVQPSVGYGDPLRLVNWGEPGDKEVIA